MKGMRRPCQCKAEYDDLNNDGCRNNGLDVMIDNLTVHVNHYDVGHYISERFCN
jgi:hypothetical protein